MSARSILLLGIFCVLGSGCSVDVLHYGAKNMIEQPCRRADDLNSCISSNHLAMQSWREYCANAPHGTYSKDFAAGYIAGFADYVESGGNGNPPVMPPWRYRKLRYESPEGHQAIEDWFAGFRAGTAAAHASGYREAVILPLAVSPAPPPLESYATPAYAPEPTLPSPKPIPNAVPDPGARRSVPPAYRQAQPTAPTVSAAPTVSTAPTIPVPAAPANSVATGMGQILSAAPQRGTIPTLARSEVPATAVAGAGEPSTYQPGFRASPPPPVKPRTKGPWESSPDDTEGRPTVGRLATTGSPTSESPAVPAPVSTLSASAWVPQSHSAATPVPGGPAPRTVIATSQPLNGADGAAPPTATDLVRAAPAPAPREGAWEN